jgi:hypothetical protein
MRVNENELPEPYMERETPLLGALDRIVEVPHVSRIAKLSAIGCARPSTLWFS